MGDFDTTAVRNFATELRDAPGGVRRKVSGSLTRHTNQIRRTAQENVRSQSENPRPWLATQGVQRDTRTMSRRVYSPPDDTRPKKDGKGRNVGMHQELGTTGPRALPARPWLVPALAQHRDSFVSDLERIVHSEVA